MKKKPAPKPSKPAKKGDVYSKLNAAYEKMKKTDGEC